MHDSKEGWESGALAVFSDAARPGTPCNNRHPFFDSMEAFLPGVVGVRPGGGVVTVQRRRRAGIVRSCSRFLFFCV